MALILQDRVKEVSNSSGTGSITLAGAYTGYRTFNSCVANGSTVYYTIHNTTVPNDGEWEVGLGTFTAPATLSRDTVLSSSNGGAKTVFSSASDLEVFITQPAGEAVYINQATNKVEAFGNGANTITFTNINTTNLVANTVTLTAGTISTNAANATDITNKTYVDGLFSTGISYHDPVLVEEDVNLVAVYSQPNGAGNGVGATLTNSGSNVALVVDGVSVSNTARILVYAQSNAVQNGVYTVTNPGNVSAQWVLTRATDADTFGLASPNKLGQGDAFFVTDGNTGAGRTYICNTAGTITFGSTNITFAEISSSQIYAAGTGLNLANLTFSISNTAVTAAQYGNDGAVGQFTVNAQGQLTNAANVAINASSISVGTLANARTTAASANGASTIVARDANGNFTANVITATTSNATTFNGTTGAFTNVSGNGVALTAINASNISSGTIANARTTASDANSASTIVARDANGSFGANIITATFSGNGATLSAINASNISSGTIANARTTASSSNGASTIVQRDSGGNFSANTVTAAVIGDLSGGSNINASNIASGTIANARTTASSSNGASTIVLRGSSGEFAAGAITGTSFSGNGSAITAINATAITTGTLDNARTTAASANGASTIVARDAGGNFSANTITATTFSGAMSGNGAALTNINASNISSGTIANARTTASDANGASTIVSRDANGSFSANIITANGSAISAINGSNVTTGTVANARTTAATANGASTIVLRGTSGEFSAGAITAADITDSSLTVNRVTYAGTSGNLIDSANMVFLTQYNTGANPSLYSLFGMSVGTGTLSYPSVNTGIGFYSRGPTSMGGFLVQDGNGRLNQYWNAYTDAGIKYIVSGEPSARYLMSVNGTTGGVHAWYGAPSGTAGAAISFTQMGQMTSGTGGSVWFSPRGTSTDFSIGITGGVSIGNTTDPGATNLSVTGTGSFAGGSSSISLTNATSNWLLWNTAGVAAPTFTTRSAGTKLVLYPSVGATQTDYAIGIVGNTQWYSIPENTSAFFYRWYAGTTSIADLRGDGVFTATSFSGAGTGLTGTASSLSIGGSAATATSATSLNSSNFITQTGSSGNFNTDFTNTPAGTFRYNGDSAGATNNPGGSWWLVQNMRHTNASSLWGTQVAWGWEDNANRLATRNVQGGSFGAWVYYLNSANVGTYALPIGGGTLTGLLIGASSGSTDVNTANDTGSMSIRGSAGTVASVSFHRVGAYAINMGVGTDNVFRIGGWSASSNAFQMDGSGNLTMLGTVTATNPFFVNTQTVAANYTVPASRNAMSAGPITINTGVTVTVSTGSSWVIV